MKKFFLVTCLLLAPLGALRAQTTAGTVSLTFDLGLLTAADGITPLADGALVQILAATDGAPVAAPTFGDFLGGSSTSLILWQGAFDSTTTGIAGATTIAVPDLTLYEDGTSGNYLTAGGQLIVRWFPTLTTSATVPGATSYGQFGYSSISGLVLDASWVVPGAGAGVGYSFLTDAVGGILSDQLGRASSVTTATTAVPEPAISAIIAGLAAFALGWWRRVGRRTSVLGLVVGGSLLAAGASTASAVSTVYLASDSTVADYAAGVAPREGWGMEIAKFFDASQVTFVNDAVSGRGSKTFIEEGRLSAILSVIKPGDYLFVQFGHNDSHDASTPEHTDPQTTYKQYLQQYIDGARNAGAIPVLITPVGRRRYDGTGTFTNDLAAYSTAMIELAAAQATPVALIDLSTKSDTFYTSIGVTATTDIFLWLSAGDAPNYPTGVQDSTHFQRNGAIQIAHLVAQGAREIGGTIGAAVLATPTIALAYTTQPQTQTVSVASAVTLKGLAAGYPAATYQWSKDGTPISGATANSLVFSSIQFTDAGSYTLTATNSSGTVTSSTAVLTVTAASPAIATQPASLTVNAGATATFTVGATGSAPLSYQWYKGGAAIAGATSATYSIATTVAGDAGNYAVTVTNSVGSVTSQTATLLVLPAAVTPVVMDDKFADGEHSTISVPTSAQWVDTQAADVLTDGAVSNGQGSLTITTGSTSSSTVSIYFTQAGHPISLGVGDTLTIKLRLAFSGLNAANTGSTAQFRSGLFDSQATRNTTNGDTGYGLWLNAITKSASTSNNFAIYRRTTNTATNLFSAGADFTQIGTAGGGAFQALADATDYTITFSVYRQSSTVTALTAGMSGGTLTSTYQTSVTETTASANTNTTFDYYAFRIPSKTIAAGIILKEFEADYTPQPPTITAQPPLTTVSATVGSSVSIPVSATGTNLVYQWTKDGADISAVSNSSAAQNTLVLSNVQAGDAGGYQLVVSNAGGSVASQTVNLNVVSAFTAFVGTYGLAPATTGAADADPDNDGVSNLLEFVLGGDPTHGDRSILPTCETTGTGSSRALVYRFSRNAAALSLSSIGVEYSTDLANWTTAVDGVSGVTIAVSPIDGATDQVTVTIPANGTAVFARLKAVP